MVITKPFQKMLKIANCQSNKLDITSPILNNYANESASKMLELNSCA